MGLLAGIQQQCSWWAEHSPEHVVPVWPAYQVRPLTAMPYAKLTCWKQLCMVPPPPQAVMAGHYAISQSHSCIHCKNLQ